MKGQDLYARAKALIPGGTQLLSKRPEQFLPDQWPAYYSHARGIEVTDLDGTTYLDMSVMGIGACILGYSDPDVDSAAKAAIEAGSQCTLNAPEEVALAELLCELHPWADMVRYARGGGEAMSIAVRIARAFTKRDVVAFCGYHGWTDWYLAANLGDRDALDGQLLPGLDPAGVPRGLTGTAFPFHYNRIDQLESIVHEHPSDIAAIVMEPQRDHPPEDRFLQRVREIATRIGAVLIFDEVTTGFRVTCGGIHLLHGVDPDVAVFAKAIANGYAMAAVIGRQDVMQAAQSTFISSTNWTERVGPAAALATIEKHRRERVDAHIVRIGERLMAGLQEVANVAGVDIEVSGLPSICHFSVRHRDAQTLHTLFVQEMLGEGYLAFNQFKPSLAHTEEHVDAYLDAAERAFVVLKDAVDAGSASDLLHGPAARSGFYRLT